MQPDFSFLNDYIGAPEPAAPPPKKGGRGGFLTSLISEIGGTGGAVKGAAFGSAFGPAGTLAGALLGGFGGGTIGRLAENKVRDDEYRLGDALKEGATSAVFGAGPIRLLKGGAAAGKAAMAGSSIGQALQTGGKKALAPGVISRTIGRGATSAADDFTSKSLKLNNSGFNRSFFKRTGEQPGQFARRFKVPQLGPDNAVETVYKPAAQAYSAAVGSLGTIGRNDVLAAVRKETADLIGSRLPEQRALGKEIVKRAGELTSQYGKSVPALELQKLKGEVFDLIDKRVTDKAGRYGNNIYDRLGKSFKTAINDAADKAGVRLDTPELAQLGFKSQRLGDMGEEMFALSELLEQAATKAQVGTGTGFGSLRTLMAASAAGPAGIVPAMTTAGVVQAANSRAGRKFVASNLSRVAEKAGAPVNPYSARRTAGRILGGSPLQQALTQSSDGSSIDSATNMNPMTNPTNIQEQSAYGGNLSSALGGQAEPSGGPFDPANLERNAQAILAAGGDFGDVAEYVSLVQALQEVQGGSGAAKGLNSTAAGVVTDLENGITNIRQLSDQFASSSANAPLIGSLRARNPFDTNAQSLQANIARVKQVIGKALEGGVLRKEDEIKYAKILPTLNDTDAVAQEKIAFIADDLTRKLGLYRSNLGTGGGGSAVPLTDALALQGAL